MKDIKMIKLIYEKERVWDANYLENFFQYLGIYVWKEVVTVSHKKQESFDSLLYIGKKEDNIIYKLPEQTIFLDDIMEGTEKYSNLYTWNTSRVKNILFQLLKTIFGNMDIELKNIFHELIIIYLEENLTMHSATLDNKFDGNLAEIGKDAFLNSYKKIKELINKVKSNNINYYPEFAQLYTQFSANKCCSLVNKMAYFKDDSKEGLLAKGMQLVREYPCYRDNLYLLMCDYCLATEKMSNANMYLKILFKENAQLSMPDVYNLEGIKIQLFFHNKEVALKQYEKAMNQKKDSKYYLNFTSCVKKIAVEKIKKGHKEELIFQELEPLVTNYKEYFEVVKEEFPEGQISSQYLIAEFNICKQIAELCLMLLRKEILGIQYISIALSLYKSIDTNPYFDWIWKENATNAKSAIKEKIDLEGLSNYLKNSYSNMDEESVMKECCDQLKKLKKRSI